MDSGNGWADRMRWAMNMFARALLGVVAVTGAAFTAHGVHEFGVTLGFCGVVIAFTVMDLPFAVQFQHRFQRCHQGGNIVNCAVDESVELFLRWFSVVWFACDYRRPRFDCLVGIRYVSHLHPVTGLDLIRVNLLPLTHGSHHQLHVNPYGTHATQMV